MAIQLVGKTWVKSKTFVELYGTNFQILLDNGPLESVYLTIDSGRAEILNEHFTES